MPAPMVSQRLQVGAPDPELETSPILDDEDDLEVEPNVAAAGVCRFNGVAYRTGDHVLSGGELLRCEPPGVWVREGDARPRKTEGP